MTSVLPYGDRALLVEVDSLDEVLALYPALTAGRVDGVLELVPAARTVLVTLDPVRLSLGAAENWVRSVTPAPLAEREGSLVTIDVVYDGEDLAEVAQSLGIAADDVIRLHTTGEWHVAFIGFAPGFAYLAMPSLGDSGPALDIPRRATSRPRVPAGAVGLAGEFTGIYPRSSPGGWQLIGRTDALVWDPERPSPALLQPGMRVQFKASG